MITVQQYQSAGITNKSMHSFTWRQCKIHVLICQIKVIWREHGLYFFQLQNSILINWINLILYCDFFLNEVLCSVFVGKFTKISYIFIHVLYVRGIFFLLHHYLGNFFCYLKCIEQSCSVFLFIYSTYMF